MFAVTMASALHVLPPHEAGPRSKRTRATSPIRRTCPADVVTGSASRSSRWSREPLREADHHARSDAALDDLARHRALEEGLDGARQVGRRDAVPGHRRAVEVDQQLRARWPAPGSRDRRSPGTSREESLGAGGEAAQDGEVRAEDLDGQVGLAAGDHVVDAVADRLAEADAHPRDRRDRPAHLGQQLAASGGPAAARLPSRRRSRPARARPSPRGRCAGSSRRPRGTPAAPARPLGPRRRSSRSGDAQRADDGDGQDPSLNGGRNAAAEEGHEGERHGEARRAAPPSTSPAVVQAPGRASRRRRASRAAQQARLVGVEERLPRQQQEAQDRA